MRYLRAKHPAIAWCLIPWFLEGNQTKEEIFLELYDRLENDPDNTFVEVALEGDMCKGVLIAYDNWVWQAHADNKFEYSKAMFNHLVEWAKDNGHKTLKAACSKDRNAKLIMRRFGFKKDGNQIIKEIA